MKRAQKVKLSLFREDPDNVSVATDEEIQRLAGKLKRVPLGLTAMRIAYVTDAPGGGRMVISGNKRLRCLKAAYGEDGEVPAEWFQDITAMSEAERHEFRINANISDGSFDAEKLLAQYDRGELAALMSAEAIDELLKNIAESPDAYGDDFTLPDGEKPNIGVMSFTLSQSQVENIKAALKMVVAPPEVDGNTNANGNKLNEVIVQWMSAQQKTLK